MNGDGYSDVVVGAYGNTSSTGKAYLYLGSASGLSGSASIGPRPGKRRLTTVSAPRWGRRET